MKSGITTILYRVHFTRAARYQVAYDRDVLRGRMTDEQWNLKPRLANRDEMRNWINQALESEELRLTDNVPNLSDDGGMVLPENEDDDVDRTK